MRGRWARDPGICESAGMTLGRSPDQDGYDVWMRRFDPLGRALGEPILVSAFVEPPGVDITVASTENMVRYYARTPLKQLIYFSNTCVYGDTTGRLPTENNTPTPNTHHGQNKSIASISNLMSINSFRRWPQRNRKLCRGSINKPELE